MCYCKSKCVCLFVCVRACVCVCVCVCVFVEQVNIFRFLGIIITENLSWPSQITALIKKKKKKGGLTHWYLSTKYQ